MKQPNKNQEEKEKFIYFNKVKVITRDENGIEVPYLIRRTLFAISKFFSLKLHKIILSDETCTHDHPWPFLTVILKGGYYEWTPLFDKAVKKTFIDDQEFEVQYLRKEIGKICEMREGSDGEVEVKRWHGPGSVLYRPAEFRHQLELKNDENGNPIPATTFVITGRVIRKWGFFTKKGWIYSRDYNKQKDCN